jgi:hypothetical protein
MNLISARSVSLDSTFKVNKNLALSKVSTTMLLSAKSFDASAITMISWLYQQYTAQSAFFVNLYRVVSIEQQQSSQQPDFFHVKI